MKKLIYILPILFMTACNNYLDVQPQGMVIPKTDDEFAAIIQTHLRDIEGGGDENIIGNMQTIADREGCADDLDANIKLGTNLVSYAGEIINRRQSDYRNCWQVIKDCNIVIENLQSHNSVKAHNILSCAYAIKAIVYYNLIRDYCEAWDAGNADKQLGLPIVDKFNIKAKPKRENLRATADYTLSLFDRSLAFKPQDPLYIFTEYIVKGYKAKLLFWIEDWDSCSSLCEDIMKNSGYKITPINEYANVINSVNEKKGEVMLRAHINNSSELDWYFTYIKGYIASRPANSKLIKIYGDEAKTDIRFSTSFDSKRCNIKVAEPKLRLSEILLMNAECKYHQGKTSEALSLINKLRENRIKNVQPYSLTNLPAVRQDNRIKVDARGKSLTPLMQLIMDERRKELFIEGDRWFELKRNGSPEWWIISNSLKYTTKAYLYTAPIYKGDVDMNPEIIQNPGYIY